MANELTDTSRHATAGARPLGGAPGVLLLAIGFGCMLAYTRVCSLGFAGYLAYQASSADPWFVARTLVELATFLVLAFASWKGAFKVGLQAFALATVCAIAAAMIYAVDSSGGMGALVAVLGGSSMAVIMYVWMLLLSSYKPRSIVIAVLGGTVLSELVVAASSFAGSDLALLISVGVAFLSGVCVVTLDPGLSCCSPSWDFAPNRWAGIPWLTVIMVLACGFSISVLYGVAESLLWLYDWHPDTVTFVVSALLVIGATAFIVARASSWMQVAWVPLFALFACAIICSCLPVRATIEIATGFMLSTVFSVRVLYWIIFPALFSSTSAPRTILSGVVLALVDGSFAMLVGDALGAALPRSMQSLGSVSGLMAILVAILLVAVFGLRMLRSNVAETPDAGSQAQALPGGRDLLNGEEQAGGEALASENELTGSKTPNPPSEKDPSDTEAAPGAESRPGREELPDGEIASDGNGPHADSNTADGEGKQVESHDGSETADAPEAETHDGQEESPADLFKTKVDECALRFGLTARESEVAWYTAQGYSGAYIADKLVVSNSTVRFHQQNIYRKCDVHSRNEFIELVLS